MVQGESAPSALGGHAAVPRWRKVGAALVAGAGLLLAAGCQGSGPTVQAAAGAVEKRVAPQAKISIEPAASAASVRPDAKVKVTVADGKLTQVTVTDDHDRAVPGKLADDALSWTASGGLRFGTNYWVRAEAVDAKGLTSDEVTVFTTLTPKGSLTTAVSPLNQQTVGVGMPIIVRLSDPVTDRAAVESRLTVASSKPIEGAWRWVSDRELHYRPQTYWPAYTDVRLDVRLRGVDAGKGVWGAENRTIRFRTGASMISVVDVRKHTMTVYRNGKVARRIPISTGKDGFLTRNGIKVVSEKHKLILRILRRW